MAKVIFYNTADLARTVREEVRNSLQPLGDKIAEELADRAEVMGFRRDGGLASEALYDVNVSGVIRNTVTVTANDSALSPRPGGNPGYEYLNKWGSVHWLVDGDRYWRHTSPIGDDLSAQGLIDVVTQGRGGHFIENDTPRMFAANDNPTWHARDYVSEVVNRPFLKALCRQTLLDEGIPLK